MLKQNIGIDLNQVKFEYEGDIVDQMLRGYDEEIMALPDLESEPHLLISKVRKHYMEYIVKLLSTNYETHQKLLNKNIYLPSAIWRCAKQIELKAAQACMVVQIYRKNIIPLVKELKNDTKKGKLNRKLYECLNKPPANYKKTQTTNTVKEKEHFCECGNIKRKRRQRGSVSPEHLLNEKPFPQLKSTSNNFNSQISQHDIMSNNIVTGNTPQHIPTMDSFCPSYQSELKPHYPLQIHNTASPRPPNRLSIESQDADDVMLQLEKLFHEETNTSCFEDDIFDKWDTVLEDNAKKSSSLVENNKSTLIPESVIQSHAAQIRSLDERLASLTGLLVNNEPPPQPKIDVAPTEQRTKKSGSSKWLCEEYFLKQRYFEKLDQIGESNRLKLGRIKDTILYLFGYDSDDEGILSPLDETNEFIISCKERIAPWVVKLLTPYYIKGNIRGKPVFKALAKHLIRLIYQCSKYPEEYEVHSFITDFLKNHKSIKSEADFREFRIENI